MHNKDYLIEKLIGDESFHRWVFDKATEKEKAKWEKWISENPIHQLAAQDAKKILKNISFTPSYMPDVEEKWREFELNIENQRNPVEHDHSNIISWYSKTNMIMRIAAILMIAVLLGFGTWSIIYKQNSGNGQKLANVVVGTKYREKEIILFPNGSKIILAPHSKLVYKSNLISQKTKKIKLTGQAYFDIKDHGLSKEPKFEIETTDGIVKDFGTQFNVSTFGNKTTVVLKRGVVSVTSKKPRGENIMLKPGEMAVLSAQMPKINIKKVNTKVYTSWTTSDLFFSATPLKEFLDDIRNYYGVHVVIRNPSLLSKKLSGGIKRESLKAMLGAVSHVLKINMYQKNDTVYVAYRSQKNLKK